MGEARKEALTLGFDGSIRLEFRGATISSDTGLLVYRDVDDTFALTATAGAALKDCRTGTNIRHSLTALLRQSVYSRLAGYDDVNDADRLAVDPVMRQLVGGRATLGGGSASVAVRIDPSPHRAIAPATPDPGTSMILRRSNLQPRSEGIRTSNPCTTRSSY